LKVGGSFFKKGFCSFNKIIRAKEISKFLKASGLKIQSTLQDRQIRVTGKNRDDLQEAIAALRAKDFGVALNYTNFRD
jgi:uncharacterized protein YajQ (UPF0234 family)